MAEKKSSRQSAANNPDPSIAVLLAVTDAKDNAYYKASKLPFLPRRHDVLAVGPGNDFMPVRAVFWHPKNGTEIWFETYNKVGDALVQDGWTREALNG